MSQLPEGPLEENDAEPDHDPYLVWWRTAKHQNSEIKPGDAPDPKWVIPHYRLLQARHDATGYACSGLHFRGKKSEAPTDNVGVICSGLKQAIRPKSAIRTAECRMVTCPACWHRRQAQTGKVVHQIESPYWYVAWTSPFPVYSPIPERVLTRLRGDGKKIKLIAWAVAVEVAHGNTSSLDFTVVQRQVLIGVSDSLVETNRPEVKQDGQVIGLVERKAFRDREAAYQKWVDLNPHPGFVLDLDDGVRQALMIDQSNPKQGVIGRGLV